MKYRSTVLACYLGYVVQAIVNTFVPLLLLTFQREYEITTAQMTLLITANFLIQLVTDLGSPLFIDKIGYRTTAILAHIFTAVGLGGLSVLPELCADPFVGLMGCVCLYAVGGGLLEVVISPIVEALPLENKEKHMSLLHSFYCWGQVGVILISTLFFAVFGMEHWKLAALFWGVLSVLNVALFLRCPIHPLIAEGEKGDGVLALMKMPIFWLAVVMMVCSGASENGVSQWLSTFLESNLAIPKNIGDLAGPCGFAALMGASRVIYARYSEKVELKQAMTVSCLGCVAAYLMISLSDAAAVNILGCLLCGFFVGLLWPGTFSLASAGMKRGGTFLFAFLALAGDIGCAAGTGVVGFVTEQVGNMRAGILAGCIFPFVMLLCSLVFRKQSK